MGGEIFKIKSGFTLIELLVSIAIVVTLIAVFIPGFDNYKKRQDGTRIAQEIIQQVQLARSYALAPNVANFPASDPDPSKPLKNIIEFAMLNNNDGKIQYMIGRTVSVGETILSADFIKPETVISGDWSLDFDEADKLYLDSSGTKATTDYQLTIGFQYNTADFKLFERTGLNQGKTVTGYDVSKTRVSSTMPIYIVPAGKAKSACTTLSVGCVKIELNLITGAMTYVSF